MSLQRCAINWLGCRKPLKSICGIAWSRASSLGMASSTGTPPAVVAVGQMRSTNDKAANMRQVEELLCKAKEGGAAMLFLPECCDFVGGHRKETIELAEPLSGATMQQYRQLAAKHGIWLSLGGVHEAILDGSACKTDKIFNSHVVLDGCGEVVDIYRKLHLFDADNPELRLKESDTVTAGDRLVAPLATPLGRLGLQICYDLRFAEASLLLRKDGAQILTYPSAFTYATGKAHWEVLLRARAIENQCYVLAAAQVGFHNKKRQSWGHALIVDPWGKLLADCGGEEYPAVVTAPIDLALIASLYKRMPCFAHRRDDVYTLTTTELGCLEAAQDRLFAHNSICKDTIFLESRHCFAFTNLRCVVKGHVLVATKRVTPRLNALDCAEVADLFTTVCKVQRMLEAFYGTSSATVTVQDGADAGQTVPHVHFHVMPRRPGDFGHNDQIYVKLEDCAEDKPNRTIEQRIEEAGVYRQFLRGQRA